MSPTGNTVQGSKPKKRIVTTARREQNRAAQRAWRQRQRQNCAASIIHHERAESVVTSSSRSLTRSFLVDLTTAQRYDQEISATSPEQTSAIEIRSDATGYIDPRPTFSSLDLTSSGVSSRSLTSGKEENAIQDTSIHIRQTDLKLNTLQTTQTQTRLALLHNATCLGFNISDLMNCDKRSLSPFFCSIAPTDNAQTVVANKFNPSTPIHLQPTMAQILVPHHAALDLIPLPLLRDRAIMLSFAMPEVFDLWDLKLDIYVRHGIVLKTGGDNLPWDPKNWDMKPWFGRKWGMPACE